MSINKYIKQIILFTTIMLLNSCGTTPKSKLDPESIKRLTSHANSDTYLGHYKIGAPYTIKNILYKPRKYNFYNVVGIASWYGERDNFHGKHTANGDVFHKDYFTAAHKTLPLPSMVRVTNLSNNKSLIIMVNDRGPFHKNRIIDLSEKAAEILEYKHKGTAKVRVTYLPFETEMLLRKLGLEPNHGYKAKRKMQDHNCSIHCYLSKVNKKSIVSTKNIKIANDIEEKNLTKIPNSNKPNQTSATNNTKNKFYIISKNSMTQKSAQQTAKKINHYARTKIINKNNNFYVMVGPINSKNQTNKMAAIIEMRAKTNMRVTEGEPRL